MYKINIANLLTFYKYYLLLFIFIIRHYCKIIAFDKKIFVIIRASEL
jgi:hypothetical protein